MSILLVVSVSLENVASIIKDLVLLLTAPKSHNCFPSLWQIKDSSFEKNSLASFIPNFILDILFVNIYI